MISMKKLGLILCTAVLSVGLLAGCGSDKKEAQLTQTAGVLKVGSETTFPPFEFAEENTNKYIGFDVDLSEEVAKRLGLKLEFVSMGFDALIPATQSGNIDMIAAGINATSWDSSMGYRHGPKSFVDEHTLVFDFVSNLFSTRCMSCQPPAVVTVILKVRMHCEACAQVLQKRIRKIQGIVHLCQTRTYIFSYSGIFR